MERVLPDPILKDLLADLVVGLAADCDRPERDVEKIMSANLSGASMLPFVGLVTCDGQWVDGFSGGKNAQELRAILQAAEKSPLLQASDATRKELAGLVEKATAAREKGDWKAVLKSGHSGERSTGRCPERKALAGIVDQAHAWAEEHFAAAIHAGQTAGDLAEARKALGDVKKQFAGEPEAEDAATGIEALRRMKTVLDAEARGSTNGIRERVAHDYADTRWAKLFEPAPKEEAAEPEDAGEE